MYCKNCGKEIGDSRYCPYCGSVQEDDLSRLEERYGGAKDSAYGAESYYSGGTGYGAAERMRGIFRDTKFLVITILMTVNAVAAVFGGSITINNRTFSVNLIAVFPILFCIGLWLCWAEGRKQTGDFSTTGLAMISGTAKAQWIVVWVGAIMLLVFGILFIVAAPSVISNFPNDIWKLIPGDFYNDIPGMEDFNIFGIPGAVGVAKYYYESAANAVAIGLGIVMVLVAVVMVILNIFFYKKLHRFTKSICESVKTDRLEVACVVPVKNWLIVSAVFSFLGALGVVGSFTNFLAFAGSLCGGLAAVFASIMIKNYLIDSNY